MYGPIDLTRIDRQIEDLQRIKAGYQGMNQQPINNIINTQQTQPLFEARYTTENPSDIFVQNKTAFIDLKNGKLSIKETDGNIKEYILILPKDEKDLRIEQLELKLRNMEGMLNEYNIKFNESTITKQEPTNDGGESSTKRPKRDFFKSNESKD